MRYAQLRIDTTLTYARLTPRKDGVTIRKDGMTIRKDGLAARKDVHTPI